MTKLIFDKLGCYTGSVVFVRNDVFELASEHNADKGKILKETNDPDISFADVCE